MDPLALLSLPYRLLAPALLAVALVTFGWVNGAGDIQARWGAADTTQALPVSVVKPRQAETTLQVVTKYLDRVKIIRETGDTIIKEVPVYVSPEADAPSVLSRGIVRLHDAAAAGHIPDPSGAPS